MRHLTLASFVRKFLSTLAALVLAMTHVSAQDQPVKSAPAVSEPAPTAIISVPEPGTYALLTAGLLSLLYMQRRRKNV